MLISEIISTIEGVAPVDGAESWDHSGVQVDAFRTEASRIAVALDPMPGTIKAALARGAEFILTHHPLTLKPDLPNDRKTPYFQAVSLLMKADVPLYAAHTSLDVQPDGPVGWLSRELGLVHPVILEQTGEDRGFGLTGNLPSPLSFQDILARLSERIDISNATVSGPIPATIKRVAYCTGSGSSLLSEAQADGADLFITGDVKYHTALASPIALLDVGHHSLEEEMMHVMSELLARRLSDTEVFFVPSASPMRRALDI